MPIPMVMLNDDIKAFDAYMEYLTKAKEGKRAKGHGKGLVTKKGVELAIEKIATVGVPNKKRTEIVIKQTGKSEDVEDDVYSEEIEEEEEPQLTRRRQTGVVIGCGVQHEIDEEALEHSKKLKGVPDGLSYKSPNKGLSVTLVVPDEPSDSSSSSTSKYEIKDISSDDESDGADDKEKADDSMTTGDEKFFFLLDGFVRPRPQWLHYPLGFVVQFKLKFDMLKGKWEEFYSVIHTLQKDKGKLDKTYSGEKGKQLLSCIPRFQERGKRKYGEETSGQVLLNLQNSKEERLGLKTILISDDVLSARWIRPWLHQDEGKAWTKPVVVAESLPLPTPSVLAGPNLEHSDVEITDRSINPQT
ncbi:hypothetical protein Tco_1266223 [Tanacetum coccineum]